MNFHNYFQNINLIKTPHVGIHYEQKITPDLLWCVSHVILSLVENDPERIFTDKDVRESSVFNSLMRDYFSKAPQDNAENEYNKVSSYQLGVLAFSKILEQVSEGPKKYKVKNLEELRFIAINDFNASIFLCEYTEKLIHDNDLDEAFENYRSNPSQDNYLKAKEKYWIWAKTHTGVRGEDRRHTYRVFNKIFNVFCYKNRLPGEDASNITSSPCPYSFLLYKRKNFRDVDMPSGMTRRQYQEEVLSDIERRGVVETLLKKAKDSVKNKHDNESEVREVEWGYAPDRVVEAHHILPKHSFQQFSLSKENLIVLSPDQHRSFAHNGNYLTINPLFQAICLKAKLENISISLNNEDGFYMLKVFIEMVNACYAWNLNHNTTIEILREKLDGKILELKG